LSAIGSPIAGLVLSSVFESINIGISFEQGNDTEAILRLIGTAIGAGFEIKSLIKSGSAAYKAIAAAYTDDAAEAISKYGDDFVEMAKHCDDGTVLQAKRFFADADDYILKHPLDIHVPKGTGTGNFNFKHILTESADEVNDSLSKLGYTEAPYKPGTKVNTIELTEDTKFVRVYDGVNSQQQGGWIIRTEDIQGLTPQQIQNKFALPTTPKYVTDVILEEGTQIRTGIANDLFGFDGGGTQFDLMGQYVGNFVNGRLLP
jgi:hypothetical protein